MFQLAGVYLAASLIGGGLFIVQMLLSAVGGAESDVAAEVDSDGDLGHPDAFWSGLLSVRALSAAVTVFGLSGLLARSMNAAPVLSAAIALVSGMAAMFIVAAVVGAMLKLSDDGTFRINDAVGAEGVVYVSIDPASAGKVHIRLQGRTVELEARAAETLPTGTPIVVTGIVAPGLVEVASNVAEVAVRSGPSPTGGG